MKHALKKLSQDSENLKILQAKMAKEEWELPQAAEYASALYPEDE